MTDTLVRLWRTNSEIDMVFSHQCPKCPLRFSFATELSWHVREEHRPAHLAPTAAAAQPTTVPTEPAELAVAPSDEPVSRRLLVVANQTLGGENLTAKLHELTAGVRCAVRLLVPVTDTAGSNQSDFPAIDLFSSDRHSVARLLAEGRLKHELERLHELGVAAAGEVVDADPVDRVKEVLRKEDLDGIVVSTLPRRMSRWLVMDVPHRIGRLSDVPVTHVAGPAGPSL